MVELINENKIRLKGWQQQEKKTIYKVSGR